MGDSLSLLLTTKANEELLRASKALCTFHINGTQQHKCWICFLQVHHLVPKGSSENFGHIIRLGSQDNVRVRWPKLKVRFVDQKCLQVPNPLDGCELDQEHYLKLQELKFN